MCSHKCDAPSQDQVTGLPRGFGFVHFPDPAQAHAGMVALNNSDLAGRHIYVRVRTAKGAQAQMAPLLAGRRLATHLCQGALPVCKATVLVPCHGVSIMTSHVQQDIPPTRPKF